MRALHKIYEEGDFSEFPRFSIICRKKLTPTKKETKKIYSLFTNSI